MKRIYSSAAFVFVCVLGARSLEYSDLYAIEMQTCPMKDSCRQIGNANFIDRNCECDNLCSHYDDCCIDASVARARIRTRKICMSYGDSYLGAYVTGHCPSNFAGPMDVVRQCQNDNMSDPILSAPVTDTRNRRTYLNRYCAQCNDASTSLQTWLISVECDTPNDNYTWSDLTYRYRKWTIQRRGQSYTCNLTFDKPPGLSNGPRLCRANLISSCSSQCQNQTLINACRSYTSMVISYEGLIYRNPHCALCNDETVDELACFSSTLHARKKRPFSFALLLDVNRSDGDLVGISSTQESCPSGQKYDPFFKKCRQIVCALPGYTLVNERCVKS